MIPHKEKEVIIHLASTHSHKSLFVQIQIDFSQHAPKNPTLFNYFLENVIIMFAK